MATLPTADVPLAPLRGEERLLVIDVLRGFALLGILLANLELMSAPLFARVLDPPAAGTVDAWVIQTLTLLVHGKFFTLYALLFGVGFFTQMKRAEQRAGRVVYAVLLRRMAALLGIGLVHAVLIWSGDVLVLYALLGLPLLVFRHASRRRLLASAVVLYLVPQLWNHQPARPRTVRDGSAAVLARTADLQKAELRKSSTIAVEAYRGSYSDAVKQRLRELKVLYRNMGTGAMAVFSMFLLGLWVARKGLLHQPEAHRRFLRRACILSLGLGLSFCLVWLLFSVGQLGAPEKPPLVAYLLRVAGGVGAPLLMVGYLTGVTLLLLRERWRRWLAALAPAGRMSLSNYLFQSLVGTSLFYGHGLGLYGRVQPVGLVLIAFALYLAQLVFSRWWMEHFLFGPVEWIWRSLTYGRRQPMRRPACAPLPS